VATIYPASVVPRRPNETQFKEKLGMPRVIHFEITADDPQRAVEFYRQVFDWDIKKWDGPQPYWLVRTGDSSSPGIDGGISPRQGNSGHINTIDVPSVDEYASRVIAKGGAVIVPRHAIPGVGYLAYCTDTEGSTFGLMQGDPSAK
jgi:hypothetical protein